MKQSQRIAKNLLAGGVSTAFGGLLQLVAIIVIARYVTVSEFGAYSFMFAFAFILERLADSGLNSILMRDMAVEPDRIGELLGGGLTLCGPYIVIVAVLMVGVIPFFHFNRTLSILTGIMGFARLEHVLIGCYGAVLLSQEEYELHAIGFVLHKAGLLLMVFLALIFGFGLTGAVIAHALAIIPPLILFHWMVTRRYTHPKWRINLKLWKYLIKESIPVGGAGVVRLLAEQADVMILTYLAGTRAAGLFSGPYRIAGGLRYFPQALVVALFPLYSRTAVGEDSQADFHQAYERGIKSFMLMGIPLAVLFLTAPLTLTVGLLGHQYRTAAPAMELMAVVAWLIFAAGPYPLLLTALGQQRFLFISSAFALGVRIALDFALTPRMNFLGPCVAMNISEFVLLVAWIGGVWAAGFPLKLFALLWRPCVGGFVMAAILHVTAPQSLLTLVPITMLASLVYLSLIYLLGAFSAEEIAHFKDGMNFVRPFLAEWSGLAERKGS